MVVIHVGFWGHQFGNDHLDKVAADLGDGSGWVTWNVEYRLLGIGGGYPSTLQDVAAAIDYLATLADVDTLYVVAVGHSAYGQPGNLGRGPGQQTVLWRPRCRAGIGDRRCHQPGRSPRPRRRSPPEDRETARPPKLMGGDPGEFLTWYAVADALAQVLIPAAVRCTTLGPTTGGPVRGECQDVAG